MVTSLCFPISRKVPVLPGEYERSAGKMLMLITQFLAACSREDYQLLQNILENSGGYLLQSLGILSITTNVAEFLDNISFLQSGGKAAVCQHIPATPSHPRQALTF